MPRREHVHDVKPVMERDGLPRKLVRRAASGERRVAAAAEADEGAKNASVAAARSDSLLGGGCRANPKRERALPTAQRVRGLRFV